MTSMSIVAATWIAVLASRGARAAEVDDRAATARAAIEDTEQRQRSVLSHLYTLDREIKAAAKRSLTLTRRATEFDLEARTLGRETFELERRSSDRGRQMNRRLNSLYRRRAGTDAIQSMFAAQSPAQLDQHQRYLRLMIEDDQHQVNAFVTGLRLARAHRQKLNQAVRRLVLAQREVRTVDSDLARRRREKAELIAEIGRSRETHLGELRALRRDGAAAELAFFERRGDLEGPVAGRITRAFGPFDDPEFKIRVMHKGWFFGAPAGGAAVTSIAAGRVEVARDLPGWGPTVVVDHGDHYHSVYARAARIKVREGDRVSSGQLIGFTAERSPLFGPGLYFELRHFADAVDPRTWIKDPNFTTAKRSQE